MSDRLEAVQHYLTGSASTIASLSAQAETIDRLGRVVTDCLQRGGKLLTCGNGGSAAEALHLAEELTGKYKLPRKALPAICLNADVTALTCIANDWDFASVFGRQIEALARPGDALVLFTTSGRSPNLLRAATAMKAAGGTTLGLLGRDGGPAKALCDLALVVPGEGSHIQEAHQVILHILLEYIEAAYASPKAP